MTDIRYATFSIIDVETTGLSPERDRICEIGVIKIKDGKEVNRYETLVNPQIPLPPGASAVNQITSEMLTNAPPFEKISRQFAGFIDGTILAAHNAQFDLGFINSAFERDGHPRWAGTTIDTIYIARQAMPGLFSYSLDALTIRLGIPYTRRHRSMADVEITAKLFLQCISMLTEKGIVKTLEDLIKAGRVK